MINFLRSIVFILIKITTVGVIQKGGLYHLSHRSDCQKMTYLYQLAHSNELLRLNKNLLFKLLKDCGSRLQSFKTEREKEQHFVSISFLLLYRMFQGLVKAANTFNLLKSTQTLPSIEERLALEIVFIFIYKVY